MILDASIDRLRLLKSEVLVEIPAMTENHVPFGSGTLEIVSDVKDYNIHSDPSHLSGIVEAMKKARYKDKNLMREYVEAMAKMNVAREEKPDFMAKQATRHGIARVIPEKPIEFGTYDYRCDLDVKEGDVLWWDSFDTRMQTTRGKEDDDKLIEIDGKKLLVVPAQSIHAAKTGDEEIRPVNGNYLGIVLPEDKLRGSLIMLDKSEVVRVQIVAVPKQQPEYAFSEIWKNTELEVGDIVWMSWFYAQSLDSTMAKSAGDLVKFQSRIILGIEDGEN